jgi:hypothetical protein
VEGGGRREEGEGRGEGGKQRRWGEILIEAKLAGSRANKKTPYYFCVRVNPVFYRIFGV